MHEPLTVMSLEKARSEFSKKWRPSPVKEKIPVLEAGGRVLAEDGISQLDLPSFDRAAYDGFAVRAEDTFGAEEDSPILLKTVGTASAGQITKEGIESGECMEIATGASIPEGADAVVMVEDVTLSEDGDAEIRRAISPWENISKQGSELKKGEKIVDSGEKITPQVHGALIASGIKTIHVYARPQVGVISTGDELVEIGKEISPGKVYDLNGPAISDAVLNCGGAPRYLGIVEDNPEKISSKVEGALKDFDIIITSGGSSAGSSDIVPETIDELGDPGVIVHGLAQKPGKPTLMAVVQRTPIFGLPGYPVSALMEFDQIIAPYLREMSGEPEPQRKEMKAKLMKKVLSAKGRRELVPMVLEEEGDNPLARPLRKGSGAITSLSKSDGYMIIPIEKEIVNRGEMVTVKLFGGAELG